MESQCREIVRAERANVLFFDQKRNELYKRVRERRGEAIKCTNISFHCTVAFPSTKGIAAIAVTTVSPVISLNLEEDVRFFPAVDDPAGGLQANRAKKLLAVPMMGRDDKEWKKDFRFPRGSVIAINKLGGDFTSEDIENLTMYSYVAAKVFDAVT